MKSFLKGLLLTFTLMMAGVIVAATAPKIGMLFRLTFIVVPLAAVFRPLPQLYLGHRVLNIALVIFVGLFTSLASLGTEADKQEMSRLRTADSDTYLTRLKTRDSTLWLTELKELAPDLYASETAKAAKEEERRKNESEAAEAARTAEQERIANQTRLANEAKRKADQDSKVTEYIEQLDREIISLPNANAANFTKDAATINSGMILLGAWAILYEKGAKLTLTDDGRAKRKKFRGLLIAKQMQFFPALRDAYGPIMRNQLWEADGSARTIGDGYRTVEFVSIAFARNANIKKIHAEIQETLKMFRFNRAQYKWMQQADEFSYFDMDVPKDSDIVIWESGGQPRLVK